MSVSISLFANWLTYSIFASSLTWRYAIWIWKILSGDSLGERYSSPAHTCGVLHSSYHWMELPAKVLKELVQIASSISLIYQFELTHLWLQNIFVFWFLIAFILLSTKIFMSSTCEQPTGADVNANNGPKMQ